MKVSGLDVHKDTIFCAINNGKTPGGIKEFSTVMACIVRTILVKIRVFNICGNVVLFQEHVAFFRTIAGICCGDFGHHPIQDCKLLYMSGQRIVIGR